MNKFSNINFFFKVLIYIGYRAEEDNQAYNDIAKVLPPFRKCKTSILGALIECIVSGKSNSNNDIKCPHRVFKTLHDRYFSLIT